MIHFRMERTALMAFLGRPYDGLESSRLPRSLQSGMVEKKDPLALIIQDFHAHEITEYYEDSEKIFRRLCFLYYMLFCAPPPRKMDQSRDLNSPCSLD
jgi:hypothetical protein